MTLVHRTVEYLYRASLTGGVVLGAGVLFLLRPSSAHAHSGPPPVPETLWTTWNFEPIIVLVLAIALSAYVQGVRKLWARAGRNRGVRYRQVAAGLGGFLALGIALISPLDPLSSSLFSAHMFQHMLLITVAPLLFVLAGMSVTSIWALPAPWRRKMPGLWREASALRSTWKLVTRPLSVFALHSLVLWIWHIPLFYNAAIRNELIHMVEHVTMFGTALLFWWVIVQPRSRARISYGIGLMMVFGLVIQKTALGALITFTPTVWYAGHASTTAIWGLTPLEDQQLAGAVLMGPTGVVYLIAGVALLAGWMRAIERSVSRDEQHDTLLAGKGSGTLSYRTQNMLQDHDAWDGYERAKETV